MKMNDSETDDEYGIVKTIELESEETKNIGRVKSRCVKKIAIGITPVAFLNLFFPNSTSQKKNK